MKKKVLMTSLLLGLTVLLMFSTSSVSQAEGIKAVPFYHLTTWSGGSLCHFYTTDVAEKDNAKANGWSGESIVGYISPQQFPGTIPLYRYYYPGTNDHMYTADLLAKDAAVQKWGWSDEGIEGYVLPTSSTASDTVLLYQKYDGYQHEHFYATTPENTPNYAYELTVCRIWQSDSTIADINLTFPTGGESLTAGSSQEIKWTTTSSGGAIGLYLSPNNGLNWSNIVVIPTSNTGSLTWTVPTTYSNQAKIKAEWVSNPLSPNTTWATSVSNQFSIVSPSSPASNPASNLAGVPKGSTEIDLTWKDNSSDETGFSIERKTGSDTYGIIAVVGKDKTSFADTSVSANTAYTYRIRTWNGGKPSNPSNEITLSASTGLGNLIMPGLLIKPQLVLNALGPASSSNLSATGMPGVGIKLTWTDNSSNETGFILERKAPGENYAMIAGLGSGEMSYVDTTSLTNTVYFYRIKAVSGFGDSNYSNETSTLLPPQPNQPPSQNPPQNQNSGQTVVKLYPGKSTYTVNGELNAMDVAPLILNGRTLLPVRYVFEPFGASVDYSVLDQKVKVVLGSSEVYLWIDKNTAQVNGTYQLIDSQNPIVTPVIVPPGRTMLPIRFIAESLGCQVDWNPTLQEVTVSYPK